MKRLLSIATTALIALSILSTQPTTAKDNECERGYGQDVAECAKQPGSAKACVAAAKERKARCQSGVDACLQTCQNNYVARTAVCQERFDRETENCSGSMCDLAKEQWEMCRGDAAATLETCSNSCLL